MQEPCQAGFDLLGFGLRAGEPEQVIVGVADIPEPAVAGVTGIPGGQAPSAPRAARWRSVRAGAA